MKKKLMTAIVMLALGGLAQADPPPATMKIADTPKVNVISRDFGYVKFGWSVKIRNMSNQPTPRGWLKIKWLDRNGVQLERDLYEVESIGPWKTYNATDTSRFDEGVYNQIKEVIVEFDAMYNL